MDVELEALAGAGPFWSTPEEAVRAGIERAVYLLNNRDGLLTLVNPSATALEEGDNARSPRGKS
jgi:hypothetical protein